MAYTLWVYRYFFGIGITGYVVKLASKALPSNYEYLHVNVTHGGPVTIPRAGRLENSLTIQLRNSGNANFYISRAYFRPKLRRWWTLGLLRTSTSLRVHPESDRISDKDAFELKFDGQDRWILSEYETILRPGHQNVQTTWLALETRVLESAINACLCGKLYLEYATAGKQGLHAIRV